MIRFPFSQACEECPFLSGRVPTKMSELFVRGSDVNQGMGGRYCAGVMLPMPIEQVLTPSILGTPIPYESDECLHGLGLICHHAIRIDEMEEHIQGIIDTPGPTVEVHAITL
jgi:hypothetical protein